LSFEPSGALEMASLVMRDRETDSWWSLMSSKAIGGDLIGTPLEELPVGEKATWADWHARHPNTLVLSIDDLEHVDSNPYDSYFVGDRTFRGIEVKDDRLAPKTPIYGFRIDGRPAAIAHERIEGGRLVEAEGLPGKRVLFYRPRGASVFQSTVAVSVPAGAVEGTDVDVLIGRLGQGTLEGAERLNGFDTFWYTWVLVNPETRLVVP
jgi:hypothetical protein